MGLPYDTSSDPEIFVKACTVPNEAGSLHGRFVLRVIQILLFPIPCCVSLFHD